MWECRWRISPVDPYAAGAAQTSLNAQTPTPNTQLNSPEAMV